jgi:hypothetical protein
MKVERLKPMDMTPLYRKYPGKFVALSPDRKRVIAASGNLREVLKEARRRGIDQPIVERIPWEAKSYLL